MLRKILMGVCFAYLLIAFAFIALAMLNATVLTGSGLVAIDESDARVVAMMALLGLAVTGVLALRLMLDSRSIRGLSRLADREHVSAAEEVRHSRADVP